MLLLLLLHRMQTLMLSMKCHNLRLGEIETWQRRWRASRHTNEMPNTIPMQCIVMRTSINREIGKGWMRRSRMKGKEHSSAYQTGDKLRLTPVPSMTISATAQMTAKVRVAAVVLCSCGCGSLYMLVPFCICTCTCACARCACGEVAKQSRECLSRLCTVPTTPNTPFFYLSLSTSLLLPPLPLCPLFLPPPLQLRLTSAISR